MSLTVFNFAPAWKLPSPSPFGLKVETWLRMAGIPYDCEYVQRPMESPKRTVPWIRDGDTVLADSGFIVEYLRLKHGDPLNIGLGGADLARAHAIRRMVEENLARIIGCTRWLTDENWLATREVGFGRMQEPWQSQVSAKAREKIREDMILHGIGRHSPEEIQAIGTADVRAVETLLGDQRYLFGDRPTDVDASVFGIVVQFIVPPLKCAIADYARSSPVLRAYAGRILQSCFPEYPEGHAAALGGAAS